MTDSTAQPLILNLDNLIAAKRLVRSIQRDCRATLKLLAVLEGMAPNDKESGDNDDPQSRNAD